MGVIKRHMPTWLLTGTTVGQASKEKIEIKRARTRGT